MADTSEVVAQPDSESGKTDAATEALVQFTQAAKEFLNYQHIYTQGAQTSKALSLKEAEIIEKDRKINELESAIAVWTRGGDEEVRRMGLERDKVVKEKSELYAKVQEMNTEREKVQKLAQETERLLNERNRQLIQSQKEVDVLKAKEKELQATLAKETSANEGIAQQLHTAQAKLGKVASYTASLVKLNLKNFAKDAAKLWQDTNALVEKYLSGDVSTELCKDHASWVQGTCSIVRPVSGSILIPATNTPAAKFARKAATLNMFAVVFSEFIFTGTPPVLAAAGLDATLFELMDQDENKEMLCRALLMSVPSGNLSQHPKFQQLVKSVAEVPAILFSPPVSTEMKSDIKRLMTAASEFWATSRQSSRKVVATLDYESYPDSWTDYSSPSNRRQENPRVTEASDSEDEEEVAYVAFPAILARNKGNWETIYPGILIRHSHLEGVEEEWRQEQRKRRFSRTGVPNMSALPFRGIAPNAIM